MQSELSKFNGVAASRLSFRSLPVIEQLVLKIAILHGRLNQIVATRFAGFTRRYQIFVEIDTPEYRFIRSVTFESPARAFDIFLSIERATTSVHLETLFTSVIRRLHPTSPSIVSPSFPSFPAR